MAKNIQMNVLGSDGQYEDIYPQTTVENIVDIQDNYYTKNETLTNITAALFGLGNDAVPDDVFQKLHDSYLKVGDTLTTIRTDLDDKWMLCNGDSLDRNEYSLLGSASPVSPAYDETIKEVWTNTQGISDGTVEKLRYINGYYVICGSDMKSNSSEGRIAYATSPNGPWTIVNMYTKNNMYFEYITDIAYGNGYYVAVGVNGYNLYIAYGTSLNGTWTKATSLGGSAGYSYPYCIKYLNGNFIICCKIKVNSNVDRASIVYVSNPTGRWTTITIVQDSTANAYDIIYENNKYIVSTFNNAWNGNVGTNGFYSSLYESASLNGEWTQHIIHYSSATSGNAETFQHMSLLFHGGYYVVLGYYDRPTSNPIGDTVSIAYSNNLDGPWEFKNIIKELKNYSETSTANLFISDDYMIITGAMSFSGLDGFGEWKNAAAGYVAWVNKDHFYDSEWKIKPLDEFYTGQYDSNTMMNGALANNDYIMYAGALGGTRAKVAYIDKSKIQLPSISLSDLTYTYIKVKDG